MKRRQFIRNSALVTGALSTSDVLARQAETSEDPFQLHYAPHLGMFKHHAGDNPIDQLKFMSDQGYTAFEDNGMKGRDIDLQESMARTLSDLGMRMGVFVAHKIYWDKPNLTSGDETLRNEFLDHIRDSVEVAKRVNATWMTVVPGHVDLRLKMGYQTSNLVDTLRKACEILEPHNLVMVLEPLNFMNHPGQFLTEIPQCYEICKAVDSPACKILFDIYHQQITEGNIIPNIDMAWDEIGYFQIGDNPGRKEPTTGEINYRNIFRHIHDKGFGGILGMEHGNSKPGTEGEVALIDAYREVDQF